jgi:hypothetical protein
MKNLTKYLWTKKWSELDHIFISPLKVHLNYFSIFPPQDNVSTKSTWGTINMDSHYSMTYV